MKKLLLACVLMASMPAFSQAADPSVTFGASVTNANGSAGVSLCSRKGQSNGIGMARVPGLKPLSADSLT